MKPILYAPNETNFTHNGIGTLYDCISAVVTEERNGMFELEIEYPITGQHYSDIRHSSIIKCITHENGTDQLFRVYKIENLISGKCIINAEHISYQLNYIPCAPFTAANASDAMAGFSTNALETCPFTFWTDISTSATYKQEIPASIRQRLGGETGSILDVYGGEYEFDNFNVKLHGSRGTNRDVTLRYGKNITDISQEENIEKTITGVCPFWSGSEMTDNGEVKTVVTLPEHVLHSAAASNFPYQRTITLDFSNEFQEPPTVAELRTAALAYMERNSVGIPSVSISISFITLWSTEEYKNIAPLERVYLCDTIDVFFEPLNINVTAKVIQTKYDVLLEKYNSIQIGNAKSSFAETVISENEDIKEEIKTMPNINDMEVAIEHATKLLEGGLGGYVVFSMNANDQPEEILILDKPDIAQAASVIRLNKNGIGFSTTGYEGPYTTAWTIDGDFVADFITTGTLNASLVKTGILRDVGHVEDGQIVHNFEFNLNTGACSANNIDIVANSFSLTSGDSLEKVREDFEDDIDDVIDDMIVSISLQYALSYSNTAIPTSGWQDTQPLYNNKNEYLWIRTKYTKTNSVEYGRPVPQTAFKNYTDSTVAEVADEKISAYDTYLDQLEVFNKLTNNGQSQGIYLQNGEIYINASAGNLVLNGIPLVGIDITDTDRVEINGVWYVQNCMVIEYPYSYAVFVGFQMNSTITGTVFNLQIIKENNTDSVIGFRQDLFATDYNSSSSTTPKSENRTIYVTNAAGRKDIGTPYERPYWSVSILCEEATYKNHFGYSAMLTILKEMT